VCFGSGGGRQGEQKERQENTCAPPHVATRELLVVPVLRIQAGGPGSKAGERRGLRWQAQGFIYMYSHSVSDLHLLGRRRLLIRSSFGRGAN
jgi:hypothetical protein